MKKLLNGIVDFRRKLLPDYQETFARLALGQSPDCFFVACSDSRVVPNLFASSNPGDLFVLRNVGNLVPPCCPDGISATDRSAAAALEFSVGTLEVADIIICGHSECGAMQAILRGLDEVSAPNLRGWLQHGEVAHQRWRRGDRLDPRLSEHNQLSQLNVLQQLEHAGSYPMVQERIRAGRLRLHGWWFDIAKAEVYAFEPDFGQFVVLDDAQSERIMKRIES